MRNFQRTFTTVRTVKLSLKLLHRDHHFSFYRGGNRPREHKANRKSTAKTMLEPKSLDVENQGIVKAGWNLKTSPSSSVFTDE